MSYVEKIINIATGEEITRDYSLEQIKDAEKAEKETEIRREENAKKEKVRLVAIAKLKALGFTEDEIAAL